jgi:hypothetical protein
MNESRTNGEIRHKSNWSAINTFGDVEALQQQQQADGGVVLIVSEGHSPEDGVGAPHLHRVRLAQREVQTRHSAAQLSAQRSDVCKGIDKSSSVRDCVCKRCMIRSYDV